MYSMWYPEMVRDMHRARVVPRLVEALRKRPVTGITARELSKDLEVSVKLIKVALVHLRAKGFEIENRGSMGGPFSVKGTYHLVKEP